MTKTSVKAEKVIKGTKNVPFLQKTSVRAENVIEVTKGLFMVNKSFELLALSVVTCARQELMLLSEELLHMRIASSTLSSPPLLCTLGHR